MLTVVDDFNRECRANPAHSRRIWALRMIAPHFSRSAARNTARRSGVFRSGAAGSAPSARSEYRRQFSAGCRDRKCSHYDAVTFKLANEHRTSSAY